MSTEAAIEITKIDKPLFFQDLAEGDAGWYDERPDEIRTFVYDHDLRVGMLSPGPGHLSLPGIPNQIFNPSSHGSRQRVRVNDLIVCRASANDELYKLWNPSDENKLPSSFYEELYRVVAVETDPLGNPIIACVRAI